MGFMDQCYECIYYDDSRHPLYRSGDGGLSVTTPDYDKGWCKSKGEYVRYHGDACSRFTKKSSGCFLTSACVEYRGLKDDCYELTTLRAFRDGYLKSTEEGAKLVDEYYKIAPQIVAKLNTLENKGEIYDYIYSVIIKCINLIKAGDNDGAVKEYSEMVKAVSSKVNA